MIPKDPVMMLSFLNMKLRDEFCSLDDLCKSLGIEKEDIRKQMNEIDYCYNENQNQFI